MPHLPSSSRPEGARRQPREATLRPVHGGLQEPDVHGWRPTINTSDFYARVRNKVATTGIRRPDPEFNFNAHELGSAERSRYLTDSHECDLAHIIAEHEGRLVHKWTHYPHIYDRHFQHLRGQSFKMLEIGVSKGGSLEIWRKYFGPNATIFGIDIDPECASLVDPPNQVRIGSQSDPDFLVKTFEEMGGLDIVIDDGSHIGSDQRATFRALFPLLSENGLYLIEDLHTSYWPGARHKGGYRRARTGIETIKELIDDLHGWYHNRRPEFADASVLGGLHVYDSITVIEKVSRSEPAHIQIGS